MTARSPVPGSWLVLLGTAAAARLLLQVLAMAPYAGLDEGFHVARVAYVSVERRQPVARQLSVPGYISNSMAGMPGSPPGFGTLQDRWKDNLAARPEGWKDVALDRGARPDYVAANYEAQQPSLYYAAAAPADRLFGTTQLRELLVLRLIAVVCGVITVLATGLLGARLWGPSGLLVGLLLLATPTWITLVARAGNDAPACAALAVAILLSVLPDAGWKQRAGEAVCWALAVALKVYTWPAVVLLPLLWPRRTPRARQALVAAAVALSGSVTALDLVARTGNPIGSSAFWSGGGVALSGDSLARLVGLPWLQFFKVFAGSAIWTSGEHANFLRPIGLALFVAPWVVLVFAGFSAFRSLPARRAWLLAAALLVFAIAEVGQAWGNLRQEVLGRVATQSAGLAGWYMHSLDPIWFGVGLGFAVAVLHARRSAVPLVLVLAGAFLADLCVTEGAVFRDYAGLSSPRTPGSFVRWGGGTPWEALVRLGRYGLWLPSPWLAVALRILELVGAALLIGKAARPQVAPVAAAGEKTL